MQKKAHNINPATTPFGKLLRKARTRLGLSQVEVEVQLPLSERTRRSLRKYNCSRLLVAWESGRNYPKPDMFPALSRILDVSTRDLAVAYVHTRVNKIRKRALSLVGRYIPKDERVGI